MKKLHGWQSKACCKQEDTRLAKQNKTCCKQEVTRLANQNMLYIRSYTVGKTNHVVNQKTHVGKAKHMTNKKIHGDKTKHVVNKKLHGWQNKTCCKLEDTQLAKQHK